MSKPFPFLLVLITCLSIGPSASAQLVATSSNFVLTAEPAIQLTFPTSESYQYQVEYSSNLMDWLPATEKTTAYSNVQTATFKTTNQNHLFYRGLEFPPDLTRRFVGLSDLFLDTASTSFRSNRTTISGMRVNSRDYNFNDYVIATYDLDLHNQLFSPVQLEVLTNVGPTCGTSPLFFLKDATNSIFLTNGVTVYGEGTDFSLTSTGQDLSIGLQEAQSLAFHFSTTDPSAAFQYVAFDPLGNQIETMDLPAPCTDCLIGKIDALRPGRYTVRFLPRNVAQSFSMTLRFINRNGRLTRAFSPHAPTGLIVSLRDYQEAYDKYLVSMNAGDSIGLGGAGSGVGVEICDSHGILVMARQPFDTIVDFTATTPDIYHIIYHSIDGNAHTFHIMLK